MVSYFRVKPIDLFSQHMTCSKTSAFGPWQVLFNDIPFAYRIQIKMEQSWDR